MSELVRDRQVLTPSQLNALARDLLEGQFAQVWVEGEISGYSRPASGHAYFTLKDGRVLNGIIHAQTERTITVSMVGQEVTIDRGDIVKQEQLPMSMMPEGQLLALSDEQVRNLFAYLMGNSQVPMPAAQ